MDLLRAFVDFAQAVIRRDLLLKICSTCSRIVGEGRVKLCQEVDRLLVEDAGIIPVVYGQHQFLIERWVQELSPSAMTWYLWKDVIMEPQAE